MKRLIAIAALSMLPAVAAQVQLAYDKKGPEDVGGGGKRKVGGFL